MCCRFRVNRSNIHTSLIITLLLIKDLKLFLRFTLVKAYFLMGYFFPGTAGIKTFSFVINLTGLIFLMIALG